jgi:hypothetical protein
VRKVYGWPLSFNSFSEGTKREHRGQKKSSPIPRSSQIAGTQELGLILQEGNEKFWVKEINKDKDETRIIVNVVAAGFEKWVRKF